MVVKVEIERKLIPPFCVVRRTYNLKGRVLKSRKGYLNESLEI